MGQADPHAFVSNTLDLRVWLRSVVKITSTQIKTLSLPESKLRPRGTVLSFGSVHKTPTCETASTQILLSYGAVWCSIFRKNDFFLAFIFLGDFGRVRINNNTRRC